MTVNQLRKLLDTLIANGHGRKPVCIDKRTFTNPLEDDGATIMPVERVNGPEFIRKMDEDGGTKLNADGTEAGSRNVILRGNEVDHDN